MDMKYMMEKIICMKRGLDTIDEIDKETLKNDKKMLKPILENKKPFSLGTLKFSNYFLENLEMLFNKLEILKEKNDECKKDIFQLKIQKKYINDLLNKITLNIDYLDEDEPDEYIKKERNVVLDTKIGLELKKPLDFSIYLEKQKEFKLDYEERLKEVREEFVNEYHKSPMCEENLKTIDEKNKLIKTLKLKLKSNEKVIIEEKKLRNKYWEKLKEKEIELNDIQDNDVLLKYKQDNEEIIKKIKNNHLKQIEKLIEDKDKEKEKEKNDLEKHYKNIIKNMMNFDNV